jgi:NADH dehydrogenase/NADH:ubiquinone oxidoreductase subunit G
MSIEITIDGRKVRGNPDQTILDVAKANGVHIPTLCNHPHLKATGACRICVVDLGRPDRLEAACTTPISPNMVVNTTNERVTRARKITLELILSNLNVEAETLDKNGVNTLLDLAEELGVDTHSLRFKPSKMDAPEPVDNRNPVIIRDRDRCILCGRCVSACNELRNYGVLNFEGRGYHTNIVSGIVEPLLDSGCASCGECVEVCPTGAFRTLAKELVQGEINAVTLTGAAFPASGATQSARNRLGLPPLDTSGLEDLHKLARKASLRRKLISTGDKQ